MAVLKIDCLQKIILTRKSSGGHQARKRKKGRKLFTNSN
jgi:hypothetical protein